MNYLYWTFSLFLNYIFTFSKHRGGNCKHCCFTCADGVTLCFYLPRLVLIYLRFQSFIIRHPIFVTVGELCRSITCHNETSFNLNPNYWFLSFACPELVEVSKENLIPALSALWSLASVSITLRPSVAGGLRYIEYDPNGGGVHDRDRLHHNRSHHSTMHLKGLLILSF